MRYVIVAVGDDGEERVFDGPLAEGDRQYFESRIKPIMRPLQPEYYVRGFAVVLHTFARYSYVLDGADLYWCVEWDPGLIVIRFSPDRSMSWVALRSPIPEFGGRTPLPEDELAYDDDAENHQANLVFRAWDSQFDASYRAQLEFVPSSQETARLFATALETPNLLGEEARAKYESSFQQWADDCKSNISQWARDGVRVKDAAT